MTMTCREGHKGQNPRTCNIYIYYGSCNEIPFVTEQVDKCFTATMLATKEMNTTLPTVKSI